jgi:dihydrofolate reductase
MIRFIAALDAQRGIATDSGIPWSLPGDKAYFREKTEQGAIVMGRATYDEFAAPLHDRENFVLTSASQPLRPGFRAVADLAHLRAMLPEGDVWIIGGAAVFRETIAEAEELLLTQVLQDFHCIKFFPPYTETFALQSRSADHTENGVTYRFETWRPRTPAPTPAGPPSSGAAGDPPSS